MDFPRSSLFSALLKSTLLWKFEKSYVFFPQRNLYMDIYSILYTISRHSHTPLNPSWHWNTTLKSPALELSVGGERNWKWRPHWKGSVLFCFFKWDKKFCQEVANLYHTLFLSSHEIPQKQYNFYSSGPRNQAMLSLCNDKCPGENEGVVVERSVRRSSPSWRLSISAYSQWVLITLCLDHFLRLCLQRNAEGWGISPFPRASLLCFLNLLSFTLLSRNTTHSMDTHLLWALWVAPVGHGPVGVLHKPRWSSPDSFCCDL